MWASKRCTCDGAINARAAQALQRVLIAPIRASGTCSYDIPNAALGCADHNAIFGFGQCDLGPLKIYSGYMNCGFRC